MEKRSALQKSVLISVAAMAVAFAILTFVFHRLEGVKFEEGFLRVSAQADDPAATVYAGKVQGERVKITVTDCPDEQRTEVVVQVGDRVHDVCAVETGLPPIQADQLGPVEHIRITRNGILSVIIEHIIQSSEAFVTAGAKICSVFKINEIIFGTVNTVDAGMYEQVVICSGSSVVTDKYPQIVSVVRREAPRDILISESRLVFGTVVIISVMQ